MDTPFWFTDAGFMTAVTEGPSFASLYGRGIPANSRIIAAPTPLVAGKPYSVVVKQPAWGGQAVTWDPAYQFPGGVAPVLSTLPDAESVLEFVSDGTYLYCLDVRTNLS